MKKLIYAILCAIAVTCGMSVPELMDWVENYQQASQIVGEQSAIERSCAMVDAEFQESGGNILYSPLSLEMALGLVATGTDGETRKQLDAYLGKEDYSTYARQYLEHLDTMNREIDVDLFFRDTGYRMVYEIANSVWVNDQYQLSSAYQKSVEENYRAKAGGLSFLPKAIPSSVDTINGWVKEKTHEMIPAILTVDSVSSDTAAVLVNTVYFESPWRDKWSVFPGSFCGKETEMLRDYDLRVYYENEKATAFAKPYSNGLTFIGILPKQEGDFSLQELKLDELLAGRQTKYEVHAKMPKLNYEYSLQNIIPVLKKSGVQDLFDRKKCDASNIFEEGDFYVSKILQKCKIELDENGTKAAAVTAVIVDATSAILPEKEIKEVFLDRPFAFLIYDEEQEQVVFMGKVTELR